MLDNNCLPGCRCEECIALAKAHIGRILAAIGWFEESQDGYKPLKPANEQWFKDNLDAVRENFPGIKLGP